jgi:HEPN domain-containing protein
VSIYDKFAEKYYQEAKRDLERALRALQFLDYPQAVFYAQQCVEKCVKALLEVKRRVIYSHGPELLSIFLEVFEKEWVEEFNTIANALEFLTEYYTRSRYPLLFRGEVYGPEEIITRDIAEKGIELAKRVIEVTGNYLKRKHSL